MKRFVVMFLLGLTCALSFAQHVMPEGVLPSHDAKITRECRLFSIEGFFISNVEVTIKSATNKVKVLVKNESGKRVYKKTFRNCNLYMSGDGCVQVGTPHFTKLLVLPTEFDFFIGEINEKEGVRL